MSQWFKLVLRNALRHRLRTSLTMVGLAVAILSFGLLQTVIDAWYTNVDNAAPSRLITRNAISLNFPLPHSYRERIEAIEGVKRVSHVSWFGGIYKEPKNFFPQFAIDHVHHLDLLPEFLVPENVKAAFQQERRSAIVGRKLADRYGFKAGDVVQLRGTLFPGNWEFVIQGVYDGRDPKTDTSQFFFRWDYLNETLHQRYKSMAEQVGFLVVEVADVNRVAEVGQAIDLVFANSSAETLTETERAFQIGFVKQTETLLMTIRMVSFVVIFIILAVMANTMMMAARERQSEFAMLKALGFGPGYLARLMVGESLVIALMGAAIGIALTFPAAAHMGQLFASILPTISVSEQTISLQVLSAFAVGVLGALFPIYRVASVRIVDGLRGKG